jgi:hypothetical protein
MNTTRPLRCKGGQHHRLLIFCPCFALVPALLQNLKRLCLHTGLLVLPAFRPKLGRMTEPPLALEEGGGKQKGGGDLLSVMGNCNGALTIL